MKGLNHLSILENSKATQVYTKNGFFQNKFIDYLLLLLIFIFFAVPVTGLSLHYYKFGLPPRLIGFLGFFLALLRGIFSWI